MELDHSRTMVIVDREGNFAGSYGHVRFVEVHSTGAGKTPSTVTGIAGRGILNTQIEFMRHNGWITSTTWAGYRVANLHVVEQTKQNNGVAAAGDLWGMFA